MTTYTVYRAPGWHSEPDDPVIMETLEKEDAAMRAGCRVDIHMPGGCNPHDAYALDDDGELIDPIESFQCEECGELCEWGKYGPVGTMRGEVLECAGAMESHLVTWLCRECADELGHD